MLDSRAARWSSVAVALAGLGLFPACGADGENGASGPGNPGGTGGVGGGGSEGGGPDASQIPYEPCAAAEAVGGFRVELAEQYTQVEGQVFDAVEPASIPVEIAADEECRLLLPPSLLCDPACAFSTETCGTGLTCVPLPQAINLGTVSVTGLAIEMTMEPSARTRSYSNPARPALPHPGFAPGADLRLSTGGGDLEAFELRGWGVSPLVVTGEIRVDPGQPSALSWEAPVDPGPARLSVNLDINVHGSGGARIECDFADDGSAEISAALIDGLIAEGLSGFPSMTITRRTATSTRVGPGCIDFTVAASTTTPVQVAGIQNCNEDVDCGEGGVCLPILRNCE